VATSILKQNERGGMGLLQRQMMDSVCKGFSVHDIAWKPLKGVGTQRSLNRRQKKKSGSTSNAPDASGGPALTQGEFLTAKFTHAPLQFFENKTGKLRYLKSDFDHDGVEMKEGEWLVSCSRPLMKAASIGYIYKHLPLKFWVGYCEKFGMPGVLAKVPNKKGDPEWDEAEEAVARFMNEWGGVMNIDSLLELIEVKSGGSNLPFGPIIEYVDRMIAASFRGADLSTISQGKGDGTGASIQGDETNLLQEDDAGMITETFWDQIDRQVLWAVLGVDEPLAYLKILPPKKQAVDQDIKIDEFLVRMGCLLSQDDAFERYGRGAAEDGEAILEMQLTAGASSADGANGSFDPTNKKALENSLWGKIKSALGLANEISPEVKMRRAKRELLKPVQTDCNTSAP
jgi:phage gp29-like protein